MDSRLQGIFTLLKDADVKAGMKVLDIGPGRGELSLWFAAQGCSVIGLGIAIESYGIDLEDMRSKNIFYYEGSVEDIPLEDETFDIVVMSHVLEHCENPAKALAQVRRVLKPNGQLLVFVPPYEPAVASGHVNIGWSVGQIIYILTLACFDTKNGKFINYAGSVTGFVRKRDVTLPPLVHDYGDLSALARANLLPIPLHLREGVEAFFGEYHAVNWPGAEKLIANDPRGARRLIRRLLWLVRVLFPAKLRDKLAKFFSVLGIELAADVNPSQLRPY